MAEDTKRRADHIDPTLGADAFTKTKALTPQALLSVFDWNFFRTGHPDARRRSGQATKVRGRIRRRIRAQPKSELPLKDAIDQAEHLMVEGRHSEAAQVLERVARRLVEARLFYEAEKYTERAAQQYLLADERPAAAQHFFTAAEMLLSHATTPELARRPLEQADQLTRELEIPELRVQVLLTEARLAFAALLDQEVRDSLARASDLLPHIANEVQRTTLLRNVALQHATFAMVWEEWERARELLDTALQKCPPYARDEQLDLLQLLLNVHSEQGEWDSADYVFQKAQQVWTTAQGHIRLAVIRMHYAASLARRGELIRAFDTYNDVIQRIEGKADSYTLWLAYQNMQYMLLRHGPLLFTEFDQHEVRRLDLFNLTEAENKGYAHQVQAEIDLGKENYRGALKHIRFALAHCWSEGSWLGIEEVYQTMASLWAKTDTPVMALLAAVRASDLKAATQISETLRHKNDVEQLADVIRRLTIVHPAISEQKVAVSALCQLVDVIPPPMLKHVIDHLYTLVQQTEGNQQEGEVRRYAVMALRHLVPQLTDDQISDAVKLALVQLPRQQFWTISEELLNLLYTCFLEGRVDPDLFAPVAEVMLRFPPGEHLQVQAERVAVQLARTAPRDVQQRVVTHLQEHPDDTERLGQLTFLQVPIGEEELGARIEQILQSITPQPQVSESGTQIAVGGFRPRTLVNFYDVLSPEMTERVVDGLLTAIFHEHTPLWTRSDAVVALSDLPPNVLVSWAGKITERLLPAAEGTLKVSSFIDWQTNPFSNMRMNTGNKDQVRRVSLYALGKMYRYVYGEQRIAIEAILGIAMREISTSVREGVAMALNAIASEQPIPQRLWAPLVVLAHDPASEVCSRAAIASGHAIGSGTARGFADDLFEQLLHLAGSGSTVEMRMGAAIGLRTVALSSWLSPQSRNRLLHALALLSRDASFRVRQNAKLDQQLPLPHSFPSRVAQNAENSVNSENREPIELHLDPTALPSQIEHDFGISTDVLARILGTTVRTIERWRAGESTPQYESRSRLEQLTNVRNHLFETFATREAARTWLHTKNRYLGGRTPMEVAQEDGVQSVEAALEALDSGVFV